MSSRFVLQAQAGHVVRLAAGAMVEHVTHRVGVVVDVEPVALLPAVAVEWQRLVVECVGDEQRDDLLGMLVRAVGVGAARDRPCPGRA